MGFNTVTKKRIIYQGEIIMKKKIYRLILLVSATLLLLTSFAGCSTNNNETLYIGVENIEQGYDGTEITFVTQNNTGYTVSLGWVGSCQIEVTTTEGVYYHKPFMKKFNRGKDTLSIWIDGCEGNVEKIVITELCLLNSGSGNLPGDEKHDVVVYDTNANIEYFEGGFGFFDSTLAVVFVFVVIPIVVIIIAVIVFFVVRTNKRNMEIMRQIIAADQAQQTANFNQMHNEMNNEMHIQMHNNAHQQFMQQEQMRQHTDFAEQSVTPFDQGGFMPPPGI